MHSEAASTLSITVFNPVRVLPGQAKQLRTQWRMMERAVQAVWNIAGGTLTLTLTLTLALTLTLTLRREDVVVDFAMCFRPVRVDRIAAGHDKTG